MKTTSLNIGLSLSRNYDKVTLEMVDEPISYDTPEELRAQIRQKFKLLKEEVEKQFEGLKK